MIIVFLSLVISFFQLSVAPNSLLSSTNQKIANIQSLPKQEKTIFTDTAFTSLPELKKDAPAYTSPAQAAIIYDVGSGTTLYAKNANQALPIASLTKLMTALVIMQNHSPDEIVTIPQDLPPLGLADQKIGVVPGQKFKLSELMKALLIYSANDVANSLAIWDSGSIDKFSTKMNAEAQQWGMSKSNFVNPTGLDETNHTSSAQDLLIVSRVLLQNKPFAKIVNTSSATIYDEAGKPFVITTTNKDLSLSYVYGIKTGLTDLAGECLILLAQKSGHEIITVVLNSPNRFQDSKNMVNYTFDNYIWK